MFAGIAATIALVAVATLVFSTLTYALRDLSRVRLGDYLARHGKSAYLDRTMDQVEDLVLVTAVFRMLFNTALALACCGLASRLTQDVALAYAGGALLAVVITLIFSVAVPHSLAQYASAAVVGFFIRPLHFLRGAMLPVIWLLRRIDTVVRNATGSVDMPEAEEIEQEILSVVEEGEKEGVVDEQEREMIESVIEFRDTTAGEIMTPRTDIVALESGATLQTVKQTIEQSGHSRVPVYSGTLDQVVGILYARDLLRHLGEPPEKFEMKSAMRPAVYVPESKPLRDLLRDFRVQKVHIAIVVDEYGGTAGLVTIEDILEELVGEISDEHEGVEPSLFRRIDDATVEADALIDLDEINRLAGLSLPEDAGYTTLGGFISTAIGRVPEAGAVFEHAGTKFTILDAEPQRINRVRIERSLQPVAEAAAADAQR